MEHLIWGFIHVIGGTTFVLGILSNWDNPISYVMGIVGIFYGYWVVRDKRASVLRKEMENRKMAREEEKEKSIMKKVK